MTVKYLTLNGTAFASADYFTNTGTLTFTGDVIIAATNGSGLAILTTGQTATNITVTLDNDQIGEGNETFFVILTNAAGGPVVGTTTLGSIGTNTVTIIDDEMPGFDVFTYSSGTGLNGAVFAIGVLSNGKAVIGGSFTTVNGFNYAHIALLATNGLQDLSFNPGAGFDTNVLALAVQSDDKIVVGGSFSTFKITTNAPKIARIILDGAFDPTFNPGTGANSNVNAIAIQTDGKIVVGGAFTQFGGSNVTGIVRLTSTGAVDTNFTATLDDQAFTVVMQTNGMILVGGAFTSVSGGGQPYFARLTTNGVPDATFVPIFDNVVRSASLQSDGKILVGGDFTLVNAVPATGLPG